MLPFCVWRLSLTEKVALTQHLRGPDIYGLPSVSSGYKSRFCGYRISWGFSLPGPSFEFQFAQFRFCPQWFFFLQFLLYPSEREHLLNAFEIFQGLSCFTTVWDFEKVLGDFLQLFFLVCSLESVYNCLCFGSSSFA